jgi:hypothetical protein
MPILRIEHPVHDYNRAGSRLSTTIRSSRVISDKDLLADPDVNELEVIGPA